jgi:hypothetical protein
MMTIEICQFYSMILENAADKASSFFSSKASSVYSFKFWGSHSPSSLNIQTIYIRMTYIFCNLVRNEANII